MIAVPVDAPQTQDAGISLYFGEVAYFQLYNLRGELIQTIANHGRGSGEGLSRFLSERGVTQVLFRHLGDKLFGWLSREGIESFALPEEALSIGEALNAHRERRLERVSDANLGRLLHPAGPGNGTHCHCENPH